MRCLTNCAWAIGALLLMGTQFINVPFIIDLPVPAEDWSSGFVLWRMEEATGATRTNSGSACGATQSDCNVTEGATNIDQDGTYYDEGTYSGYFDGSGEWLQCTEANCGGSTKLDPAGDFSFGIRMYADAGIGAVARLMGKYNTASSEGYNMSLTFGTIYCVLADGTSGYNDTSASTISVSTWYSGACVFDDSGNTIEAFIDGAGSGSPTTFSGSCCDNGVDFYLGAYYGDTTNDFPGRLDEGWYIQVALTDAEVCRIDHCNVRGEKCACNPRDPTQYAPCSTDADCQTGTASSALCDTGSNTCRGRTHSCTPTDCNAGTPS